MTAFRRAMIDQSFEPPRVAIEVDPGVWYTLPNPSAEGRTYDAGAVFRRIVDVKQADLRRWERWELKEP